MVHLLRIELHARPSIRAYAFLGEEGCFEYGSNYEKLSIALLQDEEGYYAALTRIEPTIQGGRLLQAREVIETFRLDHGKPVEAKWQYAGGGIGYGYIDLSATFSLLTEKDPEIKKMLRGDDHFFLADFYQAKAEDERALGNAEIQRRIAYNKSHPNYSGMDPDVKKDYIIGEDKKD